MPSGGGGATDASGIRPKPYKVWVSFRFLALTLASSVLAAFAVGRAARYVLLFPGDSPWNAFLAPHDASSMRNRPDYHEHGPLSSSHGEGGKKEKQLPTPKVMDGKEVPRTVYTSKNYDTAAAVTSTTQHIDRTSGANAAVPKTTGDDEGWQACPSKDKDGSGRCPRSTKPIAEPAADEKKEEEGEGEGAPKVEDEHLPAGQHLLVDIKDVDGSFLNSEERLADAMVSVVADSKLTLLSYHCHSLVPTGVSCVGVLLESHISFHTWPEEGVITLDLFTCGSNPLVPVMPVIERLFAVPRKPDVALGETADDVDPPSVLWSHKLRGFRPKHDPSSKEPPNPLEMDLGHYILGMLDFDMKREVASVQTKYQRIDIYELIYPRFRDVASYRRSISGDGSYESLHPEFYFPDRVVFLDGVMQSTLYGDEAYHEALVHPGMFAHPDPRRVAIIGGGEGATLREVLKHSTVQQAVMIEIDEEMVMVSREHLPSWSDCSDLIGSADWCGDDGRADMNYEDALAWFIDRFSDDGGERESSEEDDDEDDDEEEVFDVIIMDALDPQDNVQFADALYNNDVFLRAIYNGMSSDGVIIMQLGESPALSDPADEMGRDKNRAVITQMLIDVGFESIHVYDEGHSGFLGPWSYLVAFKDYATRANWYSNTAEIETAIQKRTVRTHSGKSALKYFDGPTMKSYQVPSKAFETVYCRKIPEPEECKDLRGFSPTISNAPKDKFEVKTSEIGERAGRGVFAKVDIPEWTKIALEQSVDAVHFAPSCHDRIQRFYDDVDEASALEGVEAYMHGYGFMSRALGTPEYVVDSGIQTFVNHGCDGSYNTGQQESHLTERTADTTTVPEDMDGKSMAYSPVIERHMRQFLSGGDYTLRDIKAGEELLVNYLEFIGDSDEWAHDVTELRAVCSGEKLGSVTAYDTHEERENTGAEDGAGAAI